jgi:hypothetical protein
MAEFEQRMADAVERLGPAIRETFEPLQEEYEQIVADLEEVELEVKMPDRPEPEMPDVDLGDWLYVSGREYLEQLEHYKAHKKREA